MFSRSCVEFATYLFGQLSYDYDKIIMDVPLRQINEWKRYKEERRERAILSYIKTLYKEDELLDEQIRHLVDLVMAR